MGSRIPLNGDGGSDSVGEKTNLKVRSTLSDRTGDRSLTLRQDTGVASRGSLYIPKPETPHAGALAGFASLPASSRSIWASLSLKSAWSDGTVDAP
jgi:hypothetical protein